MAFFTNQAQLRYGNEVTNSNITVGEIREVLCITKRAVTKTYGQGDTITYIVSIINSGSTGLTGLTLTDDLGKYAFGSGHLVPMDYVHGTILFYINGTLQPAPTVSAGPPLVITGLSVPAGGNATIIYETKLNSFAPPRLKSEITNTVTLSGGCITTITASETICAASCPDLTITKSVCPVPVTECGRLTYTFLIQNSGNMAADHTIGAEVTDTFDPILKNLTVTFNGAAWSAPSNYTYSETTGIFATVPGKITVPAATYTQNPETGVWIITPGVSTLVVSGTI